MVPPASLPKACLAELVTNSLTTSAMALASFEAMLTGSTATSKTIVSRSSGDSLVTARSTSRGRDTVRSVPSLMQLLVKRLQRPEAHLDLGQRLLDLGRG